jgi:hypothetical protein
MAVVVVAEVDGGSQEFFEKVSGQAMPDAQLPEGCQIQIAGPIEGGWRIITVWDTEDQYNQFRNDKLIPALREAGEGDRIAPTITTQPVHRVLTA